MQQLGREPLAFTSSYDGKSNVLANQVGITEAFNPARPPAHALKEFVAVWDTGATNSVITEKVVAQCQLKPTGIAEVHTPQGSHRTETYLVGIILPNHVVFPSIKVSKGILTSPHDVLIGMDIIGSGDFAVTNKDGKTVFTFRMPSIERIDFVKHPQYRTPASSAKVGRNAPCPCGSGKKYKNCHGRKV
jgi:hypothetical protein